jgi:hypothetical protein
VEPYYKRNVAQKTAMRWKPVAVMLPLALLIDAVVFYFGWLVWIFRF